MSKREVVWQQVPLIFKNDVVAHLDFKSRCLLARCSNVDKLIVENCPLFLKDISITTRMNDAELIINDTFDFKMTRNWSRLPLHLKENVVSNLDFKSRFNLSLCSKSDQLLVEKAPLSLGTLKFFVFSENYRVVLDEKNYQLDKILQRNECEIFLNFFMASRKLKASLFDVRNAEPSQKNLTWLIEQFKKHRGHRKVSTKILQFWGINRNCFLELFLFFHAKKFCFDDFTLSRRIIDQIVETGQWKELSAVEHTYSQVNYFRVEDLLHLDTFHFNFRRLPSNDIWKVIENYRSNPSKSHFSVQISLGTHFSEILEKFCEVNCTSDNEGTRRLTFPIIGDDRKVFMVKFMEVEELVTAFQGVRCRKDNVEKDFNDCYSRYKS